jgi:hypothetical protein
MLLKEYHKATRCLHHIKNAFTIGFMAPDVSGVGTLSGKANQRNAV